MKYDFVFVVLVYRNTNDLEDFFCSMKLPNSKVIVVNSFYDEETKMIFEKTAMDNDADFLNFPNNGYGFGNNRGCEFALKNYDFKYLVISNADIVIKKLDIASLKDNCLTAPNIITKTGKRQNPHMPYYLEWMAKWKYKLFLQNSRWRFVACMALTRLLREIYLLTHRSGYVFTAHGAFFIIPKGVLEKLFPLYNEKMFLFCEEDHLGMKCRQNGIKIHYDSSYEIMHKEDGSMSFVGNYSNYIKESYIEFYNTWFG